MRTQDIVIDNVYTLRSNGFAVRVIGGFKQEGYAAVFEVENITSGKKMKVTAAQLELQMEFDE